MIDRSQDAVRLRAMDTVEAAHKILDTMLGHLGFTATIEIQQTEDGPCLQVHSAESQAIIGNDGDRLDDFQYLVNRILRRHFPKAERVRVDCGHFRSAQEDRLQEEVRTIAERVKTSGKPFKMRPLNAYYRRLVHNVLVSDAAVVSSSPGGDERLKRITISVKSPSAPAE
jgi:spoIIIJ-associated protein